jgi:hypothetical protein
MNEMLVTNKATTNNQCKQGGFDQEKNTPLMLVLVTTYIL